MINYEYIVQPTSESAIFKTGSAFKLSGYLNKFYNLDGAYTKDIIQNYFKPRREGRKANPLMRSLYSITRSRSQKAVADSI